MLVRELMTKCPDPVTTSSPLGDAIDAMCADAPMIPVVDTNGRRQLIGVFTDRFAAVRCASAHHGPECVVARHMRDDFVAATPDESVDEALAHMLGGDMRRLPVVDDAGTLVGVITQGQIVEAISLEEEERRLVQKSRPHHPRA